MAGRRRSYQKTLLISKKLQENRKKWNIIEGTSLLFLTRNTVINWFNYKTNATKWQIKSFNLMELNVGDVFREFYCRSSSTVQHQKQKHIFFLNCLSGGGLTAYVIDVKVKFFGFFFCLLFTFCSFLFYIFFFVFG